MIPQPAGMPPQFTGGMPMGMSMGGGISDSINITVADNGGFIVTVMKTVDNSKRRLTFIAPVFSDVINIVQQEMPNLRTSDGKPCCGG